MSFFIVNLDKREYVDPYVLTRCTAMLNFSEFRIVGKVMLLLTTHCTKPEGTDPNMEKDDFIGRWAGDRVVTTHIDNPGKEMTGNFKVGNLYNVALLKFANITTSAMAMAVRFTNQDYEEAPDPDVPQPDEVEEIDDNIRFVVSYLNGNRISYIQEKDENGQWKTIQSEADEK